MKVLVLVAFLLLVSLLTAQELADEEDTADAQLSSYVAVGGLALLASLGLMSILETQRNMLYLQRPHLEDYPACGLREDDIEEPELCTDDCIWKPAPGRIQQEETVYFGGDELTVKVIIEPPKVPVDYSCLDDCLSDSDIAGSPYDQFLDNCQRSGGNSFPGCRLLKAAVANESVTNNSTNPGELIFLPQSPTDELFALCKYEQYEKGFVVEPYVSSTSLFCADFLDISYAPTSTMSPARRKGRSTEDARKNSHEKRLVHMRDSQTFQETKSIKSKTPWLCSLRTYGFRGRHLCGVTLLSGGANPILVSSAHCAHVCKDMESNRVLETCCCRDKERDASSCSESSFCEGKPMMANADPENLMIICGEFSIELAPETISPENEVVLRVRKIVTHPKYVLGKPLMGNDIAVFYIKNPQDLKRGLEMLWINPACLPKRDDEYNDRKGRFSSWIDPEPQYKSLAKGLDIYAAANYMLHQTSMEKAACKDPDYMFSNTFYPEGTVCYKDPSRKNCVTFGNSGSPLIKAFNDTDQNQTERFAWVGSLSMSKGCDKTVIKEVFQNRYAKYVPLFSYQSENPAVFTDGLCYLDWIAEQYDMKAPLDWKKPEHCTNGGTGDITDTNQTLCRTHLGTTCDFTRENFSECKLQAEEGFSYNIFKCIDVNGDTANCANNCKGVDPNSIIVGGIAAGFTVAAASSSTIGPAVVAGLGALGLGALGLGGAAVANDLCPPGLCRTRGGNCCMLVMRRGRARCPRTC